MMSQETNPKVELNELETAVLKILSKCEGEINAVSRDYLVKKVPFSINERRIRNVIHDLRQNGHLICSTEKGGYYLATSFVEYESFRRREYASRIKDMAETMRNMDASAHKKFIEPAVQPGLGI